MQNTMISDPMSLNQQDRRLVWENYAHDERSMLVHTLPESEA